MDARAREDGARGRWGSESEGAGADERKWPFAYPRIGTSQGNVAAGFGGRRQRAWPSVGPPPRPPDGRAGRVAAFEGHAQGSRSPKLGISPRAGIFGLRNVTVMDPAQLAYQTRACPSHQRVHASSSKRAPLTNDPKAEMVPVSTPTVSNGHASCIRSERKEADNARYSGPSPASASCLQPAACADRALHNGPRSRAYSHSFTAAATRGARGGTHARPRRPHGVTCKPLQRSSRCWSFRLLRRRRQHLVHGQAQPVADPVKQRVAYTFRACAASSQHARAPACVCARETSTRTHRR